MQRTRRSLWLGAFTIGALAAGLGAEAFAAPVNGVPLPGGSVTTAPVVINALPQGMTGAPPAAPAPTGGGSPLPLLGVQVQNETIPTAKPNEPPSPSGAVGPSHVLSVTNTHLRVLSRPTPTTVSVVNEVTLQSFWGAGAVQPSDTRALYDAPTDTWYLVAVSGAGTANARLLLAECAPANSSVASNPSTGTWQVHSVAAHIQAQAGDPAPGTTDIASPKIGISSRWVAVTAMTNAVGTSNPVGQRLWIFTKAAPTSTTPGTDAVALGFHWPVNYASQGTYTAPGLLSPSHGMEFAPVTEGTRAQLPLAPTFGPEGDVWFVDTSLAGGAPAFRVTRVSGAGAAIPTWTDVLAGGASWVHAAPVPFNATGPGTTAQPPAPQPAGAPALEVGNSEVQSVVLRRGPSIPVGQPGAGQPTWSLWWTCVGGFPYNQTTDRVGCTWQQLDVTRSTSAAPVWVQSGAVDGGTGVWSWRPSLAVNSTGDMCIGYTRSSAAMNPSACYDSRRRSTALGTLLGQVVLWPSAQPHNRSYAGRFRWGDFSATAVDAADDASFWTFQEHADVNNLWGVACGMFTPASVIRVGPTRATTTIQGGIAQAASGDIVLVDPGNYPENLQFGGKNIEVRTPRVYANWPGGAGLTSIRPATGSVVTFLGTEDSTALLGGFQISNGTGSTPRGGGVLGGPQAPAAGTTARIVGNDFANCIASTSGGGLDNCDGEVFSNRFQYCVAPGGGGANACDGEFRGNFFVQCNGTTLGGALNGGSGAHSDDVYQANIAPTGGAAIGGTSAFFNCTFRSNSAYQGSGGALAAWSGTVTACRFHGNIASVSGGAFSGQFGAVTFNTGGDANAGPVIFDNRAPIGGAMAGSTCAVTSNTFLSNKANGTGTGGVGGAILGHQAPGSIVGNVFTTNTSTGRGGAIADTHLALVGGQVFTGNTAGTTGGALDNCNAGTITCTFTGNSAANGGAVANIPAATTVLSSTFTGNSATQSGGAMNACASNVTTCTFTSNSAANGGAIANIPVGGTTVLSCNLNHNTATTNGGSFFQCGGSLVGNLVVGVLTTTHAQNGGAFANCSAFISTNGVTNCRASASGGAFFACSGTLQGNAVSGCAAANGGAYHSCTGPINGSGSSPTTGNTASQNGGAFHSCTGQITGVVVTSNTATLEGGGFYNCGAISGAGISSNAAGGRGGGVFGSSGTVANCVIASNTSGGNGAGLCLCTGAITACNVFSNVAAVGFHGGGMSACTGPITNNTIHSNTGDNSGGIHNCDTDIFNNTIMHNAARTASGGGGMNGCNGTGNAIRNNILYFNTAGGVAGAGNQIQNCNPASYCCIEGGGGGGSNNSNGTPSLVSAGAATPPAQRDFHQNAGPNSTVDQGQNNRTFVDFDGQARPNPNTNLSDIGADERYP